MSEFKPKILGFLCNWCSYAGADLAGTSRIKHDITMRAVRVMCSGRVEPSFVLKAFMEGADGVLIAGCHIPADCHYTNGNFKAKARYESFAPLLEELGIEKERLRLEWISASEGEKFAEVMNDFSARIKALGPLKINKRCDKTKAECPLIRSAQEFAACEAASGGLLDLEARKDWAFDKKSVEPSIEYDPNKCIRCGSCVEACKAQSIEAISLGENGLEIDDKKCVRCGQCILSCPLGFQDKTVAITKKLADCGMCALSQPVGALREKDDSDKVMAALNDPGIFTAIQIAPSVRAAIGEEFGFLPGELTTGKLYSALRKAGFDRIWDTNFAADLTVMEEGTEFLERLKNGGVLPQFTSCCPAWVSFIENNYPDLIPNLSSAKSPQQMMGAIAKTYGAKKIGIDPKTMFLVSLMPCTAKKYESDRPEMRGDVDAALTIRECVRILKRLEIDIASQADGVPDMLLSDYSGAATIFGRTGGVMTAALRTVSEHIDEDIELKVAAVSGLKDARNVCESILSGGEFSDYHFIEVMSCPGGCVGGGGQVMTTNARKTAQRLAGLNCDDQEHAIHKSHENPEIKALYEEFLGSPGSEIAHKYLHTGYGK